MATASIRSAKRFLLRRLPIPAYWGLVRMRGRVVRRFRRSPHVAENLRSCDLGAGLSAAELDAIARRHAAFTRSRSASRNLPHLRGFGERDRWPVHGREHLDAALRLGKGAILASAHFGYMPLISPILHVHGYDVVEVSGIVSATRATRDLPDTIEATLDVRPVFQALEQNRIIHFSVDGMRAAEFAETKLLGRTFPLPTGFVKIAMLTRAPILPIVAMRGTRRAPVTVEIHAPLPLDPEAPIADNVARFAAVFEGWLRRDPSVWAYWDTENLFERAVAWARSDARGRYVRSWRRRAI